MHPETSTNFSHLQTIPLLEAAGWKGLGHSLTGSLFGRGAAFRLLPEPDEVGNILLLLLKDPDVVETQYVPPKFLCVGVQPRQFLKDLYPDHDWSPWILRAAYHEPLDSPYDEVRLHFLTMIEECGWPDDLIAEDRYEPYERFEIRDPKRRYGSTPAPGESVEEYEDRLLYGMPDTGEDSGICRDFKRDSDKVWFVSGGSECFGQELCQWHNNCDAIYAAGSSTISNVGVPLTVLEDAIPLMDHNALCADASGDEYNAAHARCLAKVMKAALAAKPSEEVQTLE